MPLPEQMTALHARYADSGKIDDTILLRVLDSLAQLELRVNGMFEMLEALHTRLDHAEHVIKKKLAADPPAIRGA